MGGSACERGRQVSDQRRHRGAAKGPQHLKFPGKSEGLRRARRTAAGGRDAREPARRRHHADRKILHPQQRPDPGGEQGPRRAGRSPSTARSTTPITITLGELKKKYKAVTRRMVLECGGNGRSVFTPQARGNQWTNGGAGCAEWTGIALADVLKAAGVKKSGDLHGALRRRPASLGRQATSRRSRAACASRRRWTRTPCWCGP